MTVRRTASCLAVALIGICATQAAAKSTAASNEEGQKLAAELRLSRPAGDLAISGLLKVRAADGGRAKIPFHYRFISGEKTWQNIYETEGGGRFAGETLTVIHTVGEPNRYLVSRRSNGSAVEPVTGDKAMVPFGNSDFWLADLGLEYLHWPEQRIVHEAKIKMRKGRPCKVLESINTRPAAAGYTRVRSWIDIEKEQPILAEAYGPDDKLIKEFEIGSVTKVNGQWELKNMEMRDAKTDSQTVFEFHYEQKAGE
jgi:hypothetical protein